VKFLDEYRNEQDARRLLTRIESVVTKPWTLMEICGGQTHTLMRSGIDRMLPNSITLVHGPGCPVCVTPIALIDHAIEIALRPKTILASFGDMLRVPGSRSDLLSAKSQGGDVRMVYSPLDAVRLASSNPDVDVVFFAVGFETTAPANAMAVRRAHDLGLTNFFLLSSHVLVPPAMEAILSDPGNLVQGFLAAGHVCTVMGFEEYEPIAERFGIPITVTGFEPLDLLHGIYLTVKALEEGRAEVENQYKRAVRREGNAPARALLNEVFAVCDRAWRGFGVIPGSGFGLAPAFADFDAAIRFPQSGEPAPESAECIAGEVLRGRKKPHECPAYGTRCTPEKPLGAPMVSSEGACAAYYAYARHEL
jgi:hydrogenase expression/formation protein HypD